MNRSDVEFEYKLRSAIQPDNYNFRYVSSGNRHATLQQESPESETGLGAATALVAIVGRLTRLARISRSQALRYLAIGRRQRDAAGSHFPSSRNRTDISYNTIVNGKQLRVNIEIDRNVPRGQASSNRHQTIVNQQDGDAFNIFVLVDPLTGRPQRVTVHNPIQRRSELHSGADAIRFLRERLPIPTQLPLVEQRQYLTEHNRNNRRRL